MNENVVLISVSDLLATAQQLIYDSLIELDDNFGLTVSIDDELVNVEDREVFESSVKESFYHELQRMFGIDDESFYELFEVKINYTPQGDK